MLLTQSISRFFKEVQKPLIRNSKEESQKAEDYWNKIALQTRTLHKRGRVIEVIKETDNAVTFRFEPADGSTLDYQSGQHITLHCKINGNAYHRPYSLSKAPGDKVAQITVKSVKDGVVSNHLIENLKAGQVFEYSKVSGDFLLTDKACPRLMIAAGAGITPIRALIEQALKTTPEQPIHLLYVNHSRKDVIFHDELDALVNANPQFSLTHWYTSSKAKNGLAGSCTLEKFSDWLSKQRQFDELYLCGPEGFMTLCEQSVEKANLDIPLYKEAFTAAPQPLKAVPQENQLVSFTKSNKQVRTRKGETILEAALRAGVEMDYSCQMGGCGCCKTKIISGDVVSEEPNCLSEKEKSQGYRLACLSYACNETQVDA